MLRVWTDSSKNRLRLLLGAFRNQVVRPQYRFCSGGGSFNGPYYGIDQPSDKLTLDQFRNALIELNIDLPLEESEGIFAVMADSHGLLGIQDFLREMKADPTKFASFQASVARQNAKRFKEESEAR